MSGKAILDLDRITEKLHITCLKYKPEKCKLNSFCIYVTDKDIEPKKSIEQNHRRPTQQYIAYLTITIFQDIGNHEERNKETC